MKVKLESIMGKNGGTQFWCSTCKKITTCSVSQSKDINGIFSSEIFPDLTWRTRERLCHECDNTFYTCEIDEDAIEELVELRKFLTTLSQMLNEQTIAPTRKAKLLASLKGADSKLEL